MNVFEQKNAELVTEFDRYVREHPDFAERIPDHALVAMLVEGDEAFNRWSQEGAKRQAEKDQPIVKIKRIQPIRSRIQEIDLSLKLAGQGSSVVHFPAQNQGVTIPKHSIRLALPRPDRVQSMQLCGSKIQ
jgi:hypothetical protein